MNRPAYSPLSVKPPDVSMASETLAVNAVPGAAPAGVSTRRLLHAMNRAGARGGAAILEFDGHGERRGYRRAMGR